MASASTGPFQVVLAFAGRDSVLLTLPRDATAETLRSEALARFGITEAFDLRVRGSGSQLSDSVVLCSALRSLDTVEIVVRGVSGKRGSSSGLLGMASTAVTAAGSWAGSFFGAPPGAASSAKTSPAASGGGAPSAVAAGGGASVAAAAGSGSAASAPLPVGVAAAPGALVAGEEDDEEDCSICLEPFVDAFPGAMLRCGHAFHAPCIREWGTRSAYCPLCRSAIQAPSEAAAAVAAAAASKSSATAAAAAAPSAAGAPAAAPHGAFVRPHVLPLSPSGLPAGMPIASPGGGMVYLGSLQDNSLSPAALAAALEDTRRRLLASPEYTAMAAWLAAARKSHAAKVAGRYAKAAARGAAAAGSAAAVSAAAAGTAVLKQAADSVIRNSPLAASVAALAGYQPAAASPGAAAASASASAAAASSLMTSTSVRLLLGGAAAAAAAGSAAAAAAGGAGGAGIAAPAGSVRCPRCMQVLVPPAGAPMFRCPCGSVLAR